MNNILVTKDSKGKIRVVEISYDWDDIRRGYVIKRNTYQYGGKVTVQPEILITQGKVNRTVTEQAKLEYASHLKKYQDKGYKLLPDGSDIESMTKEEIETIIPNDKTDANGFKKHMLAKDFNKVSHTIYDKIEYWWASRKIDGVRASFYIAKVEGAVNLFSQDELVKSASRGGGHYDNATKHIRNHPRFIEFFNNHPDIIFDGELYIHGRSLQYISGLARTEIDVDDECNELEFWIYDIMIDKPFEERLEVLEAIKEELDLGFDIEHEFKPSDLKLRMVPHEKVEGWLEIKKLHDKYVEEGFEGVVIRDPSKTYGYGKRTNDMIKIKEYQDGEFEITGLSEGLREEDMCFTCITKNGTEFKAKPMGSRELKQEYRENLDNIIGKMATVKFFYLSDEGVPLQPCVKCIRDYD